MIKTLKQARLKEKKILVRFDYNVPLANGKVADDERLKASLPTIKYLLKNNCRIIIISHLGRPKGKFVKSLRLNPVAKRLSELLKQNVKKLDKTIGIEVQKAVEKLQPREIILLENVQFLKGERENSKQYGKDLASLADIFVMDAFGQAHRNYASLTQVQKFIPSYAGFIVNSEIKILSKVLNNPKKPFVAVLGGVKVSDKIKLIENLLKKVDKLLIGGAMAFTFLKAQGQNTGNSLVEDTFLNTAKRLLKSGKIVLPVDAILADKFTANARKQITSIENIEKPWLGLDIGPKTLKVFEKELSKAKTIIWNGPMGVFEFPRFSLGTIELAKFIAKSNATTIIGGGDTIAAAKKSKVSKKFTHSSTGGGAMLEFLEGKKLPAIVALEQNPN